MMMLYFILSYFTLLLLFRCVFAFYVRTALALDSDGIREVEMIFEELEEVKTESEYIV